MTQSEKSGGQVSTPETPARRLSHFERVKRKISQSFKRYGWKLGLLIVLGYLIRDSLLYIVLPYLVARNIIAN